MLLRDSFKSSFSFRIYNEDTGVDYVVDILVQGEDWVGSRVNELSRDHYSDFGPQVPVAVAADPEVSKEILESLRDHIEDYRTININDGKGASPGFQYIDPTEQTSKDKANLQQYLPQFSNTNGSRNQFIDLGDYQSPSRNLLNHYDQQRFQAQVQRGLAKRLSSMNYDLKQHYQQQRLVREQQKKHKELVLENLEQSLQSYQGYNAHQKANMLYMLYKKQKSVSHSWNVLKYNSHANQSKISILTADGKKIYYQRLSQAIKMRSGKSCLSG